MPGEVVADLDRHGAELCARLLHAIDPVRGGFRGEGGRGIEVAAHQLLWRHYMETGTPACGEAVLGSLRAIGRVAGDRALFDCDTRLTLGGAAQMLELLTWVWRQSRCPELRSDAEELATAALTRLRVPGSGFAAGASECRADSVRADWNGLMLVALLEAGSVLERRDWLAAVREIFDEIVARLDDGATLHHAIAADGLREPGTPDDHAMMSRAAIRLFEAFGKPRYLDRAIDWATTWISRRDTPASISDGPLPAGDALMISVLGRLHALTGNPRHAAQAEALVGDVRDAIVHADIAGATAVACVQTLARPVAIKVSGDPKLAQTRELMKIALDFALPDRLVLGPGAGDPTEPSPKDPSPKVLISVGARALTPVKDAARLRVLLAPGGLAKAL